MASPGTRERLVETAGELLRKQGYHATGLNQIIRESGAPRGSLYHFFPGGKEELAKAAVEEAAENFRRTLVELTSHARGIEKKVGAICDLMASNLAKSDFQAGCPLAAVTLEAADSPALRALCATYFEQWRSFMARLFVENGISDEEADRLASFALSSIEGGLVVSRAQRSIEPLEHVRDCLTRLVRGALNTSSRTNATALHVEEGR